MPNYRTFPKGDARRYLIALIAVDKLKEGATIHYVAKEIESTRAEAQRAIHALSEQFGVIFERQDSAYLILDWGVLNKEVIEEWARSFD